MTVLSPYLPQSNTMASVSEPGHSTTEQSASPTLRTCTRSSLIAFGLSPSPIVIAGSAKEAHSTRAIVQNRLLIHIVFPPFCLPEGRISAPECDVQSGRTDR